MSRSLVFCCVLVGALSGAAPSQVAFAPPQTVPSGVTFAAPGPRGLAAADLDGDGRRELVVTHQAAGQVAISVGLGASTFVVGPVLTVGGAPRGVAIGDLDGDGRRDLVVASSGSGGITLLRNLGNLNFDAPIFLPGGIDPRRVVLADVDGDGDLDVLTPNNGSHDLSLFRNAGSFAFAAVETIAIGAGNLGPQSVAARDLDGDGDMDLVVAANGSGTAVLLLNAGPGAFVLAGALSTMGGLTTAVDVADVDGDGILDLVATNFLPPNLVVFRGLGGATFAGPIAQTFGVHLTALAIADLDVDGDPDLVLTDLASNTVRALANDGAGNLSTAAILAVSPFPTDLILAPLGDSFRLDIAVTTFNPNQVEIATNLLDEPVLADGCADSAVTDGMGQRVDVLVANGSNGGASRRVDLLPGALLQLDLLDVGVSPGEPFVLWGTLGLVGPSTVTGLPIPGADALCFGPYHLMPSDPDRFVLANTIFPDPAALVPATVTPWTQFFVLPPFPVSFTLQGVLLRGGQLLRTNGIILDVE